MAVPIPHLNAEYLRARWARNAAHVAAAAAVLFLLVYGSDLALTMRPAFSAHDGGEATGEGPPWRPWAYVPLERPGGTPNVQPELGVPVSEGHVEPARLEANDLWRRVIDVRKRLGIHMDGLRHEDTTAVALRSLLPFVGGQMQWAGAGSATLFSAEGVAVITPGETRGERNFRPLSLPQAPFVADHELFITLDSAAALLDLELSQDSATGVFALAGTEGRQLRVLEADEAFHIKVSRAGRWLQVYYAGTFVKHYGACTGKGANTPVGNFRIQNKSVWPGWRAYWGEYIPGGSARNPLGARFMGTTARGRRTGWTIGIHGTNQPSSIGRRISGGCIRVLNEHIIELYEVIPIGTRVTFQD